MHPQKLWAGMVALDRRQQNASPCPNRDGSLLGTAQPFTIACGSDIGGTTMDTFDAFDLRTCADICSSFHPRCDGATFDGRSCQLKSRLSPGSVRQSRSLDSVVASFPSATSNCASLGATTSVGGTAWALACGMVIAGFDIGQEHALNLQDCMARCSATTSCAAITFDASQDQGFKNCYLKSQVTDSGLIVQDPRVDTALIQSAGNASPSEGGSAPTPAVPNQGVATVPLPTPTGGSGNGAVFFQPPTNTIASDSANSSPSPTDVIPSTTQLAPPQFLPTGTGGFTFPGANQQNGNNRDNNNDNNDNDDDNDSSSNAWIAAPVVGSVAAIALIVLSFVMLKRRRLGNAAAGRRDTLASQSSADSLRPSGKRYNISRPKALSAMITSWLPAAARGERGSGAVGGRGSRGKMGNFSEVETGTSAGRSRGSMRTSVTGLVRPAGDVEEGEGEKRRGDLRNSLNGLGQNRWS